MSDQMVSILMAGAFPPPVHGMAAVNAAVRDRLRATGVELLVIDLAASSLDRGLLARLGRLPKVVRGLVRLGSARALRGDTLYMSVSGGLGQAYEILILALARLRGMRVYLHHHSFAYLDTPSWLTRLLVRIAGPAHHVVLSEGMARRLRTLYPQVQSTIPISNTALLLDTQGSTPLVRQELRTLGFLGNISAEKGIFTFLDLLAACRDRKLPIRAKLAGPFQDAQTEQQIHERLMALPAVEYVGARYGSEKTDFYTGIDVLIFPTHYVNEAEPLTIHEAMSHAIPVIAYGRGAIPEIICPQGGRVVPPDEPFIPVALAQIEAWLGQLAVFQEASAAAARQFMTLRTANAARWQGLMTQLLASEIY